MEFSTGETDISTVGEDTVRPTSRTAKTRSKGASAKKRQTKAVTMEKDDRGSEELVAGAAADAMAKAVAASVADTSDSKKVNPRRFAIVTDESRDANLTEFGKETLEDRYLLPGENYQDLFARVADAYADDQDHAQRLYDYISNLWFMPRHPGPFERWHRARPADFLLPQLGRGQPRRDREHLERERVARFQGRRDRHLLG